MWFILILMMNWLELCKCSWAVDQSLYDDNVQIKAAELAGGQMLLSECVPLGMDSTSDEPCSLNPGRLLSGSMYPREIVMPHHACEEAASSFDTGYLDKLRDKLDAIALRASNSLSVMNCAKNSCLTAVLPTLAPLNQAQVEKCAALQATIDALERERDSMIRLMNNLEADQNQMVQSASELTTSLREDAHHSTQLLQNRMEEGLRLDADQAQ